MTRCVPDKNATLLLKIGLVVTWACIILLSLLELSEETEIFEKLKIRMELGVY